MRGPRHSKTERPGEEKEQAKRAEKGRPGRKEGTDACYCSDFSLSLKHVSSSCPIPTFS